MRRIKTPTEQIPVTDQVGKRHVVLKYTESLEAGEDDGDAPVADEPAPEYRLATGRSVDKTGDDTFQTTDGMLKLKAL